MVRQRASWCLVLFVICVAFPGPLVAQEPTANAVAPENVSPPSTDPGWERLIYLPFKRFEKVFGADGAAAFLPYDDYLRLWNEHLERTADGKVAAPVVLSATSYVINVEQQQAVITVDVTVDVLDGTWRSLPVSFGSAAIGSITPAEANPGRVVLQGGGDGGSQLRFEGPGRYQIALQLTERIRTSPEGKLLDVIVPPAGLTQVRLTVPEADQTVEFLPNAVVIPGEAAEQQTVVSANLGSTDKISIRWRPRVGTRPDMELLAGVTNYLQVSIDEALVHTDADVVFDVLRGQLEQVRLALPKDHRILDVTADHTIKQWRVDDEENRQLLTIDLLGRVEETVTVSIHTERPLPDEPFELGGLSADGTALGIHAVDALRENGQISLRIGDQLQLSIQDQAGVMRIEPSEAAERIRRPNARYYRFYSSAFRLQAAVKPIEPRIVVRHTAAAVFLRERLEVISNMNYTIERAGIFDLALKVPDGFIIDDVTSPHMKQFNVVEDQLHITLDGKRMADLALVIRGHRDLGEQTEEQFELPLVEPLGVEREDGYVTVYAPDALEVITDRTEVVAAQPWVDPEIARRPGSRFISAWEFRRRPVVIPVRTRRRPTRLAADVATHVDVQPQLIDVTTRLIYHVEYAGISSFRFAFPAAVADSLQVRVLGDGSAPGIKQETTDADPEDESRRIRTVTLQRDILGDVSLEVRYDLPSPSDDNSQFEFEVTPIMPLPSPADTVGDDDAMVALSKVYGEVSVTADRSMSVVGNGDDAVEAIDLRERTLPAESGSLAFRYFKQPATVKLSVSRHDVQEVVETVVSKGLIEAVLDREGRPTFRCRYVMKSSERQRLRIDFPAGTEPLGTALNGRSVSLEKNADTDEENSFYVNVARSGSANEPFHLAFLFRGLPLDGLFDVSGGRLRLQFPRLGDPQGTNVVVQQTRAAIWVPERFSLVGEPAGFTRLGDLSFRRMLGWQSRTSAPEQNLEEWIAVGNGGVFDFPTVGHVEVYEKLGSAASIEVVWRHTTTYTWILSGAFLLVGLLLLKTSWENKLTLLVIFAALAALYALRDADWVLHGLAAACYGLVAMLLLWIVHSLFGRAASSPTLPAMAAAASVPAVVPPPGLFKDPKSGDGDTGSD